MRKNGVEHIKMRETLASVQGGRAQNVLEERPVQRHGKR